MHGSVQERSHAMRCNAETASAAIRDGLPRETAFAGGRADDADEAMFASEASAIERAVAKRRAEFAAGRAYARRALAVLGFEPAAIPPGERREPLWPRGAVGSISHCEGYCAAVVARATALAAIGFDVEPDDAAADEVTGTICTPAELAAAARAAPNPSKTIFCIKESVYKAYFPLARTFLEFSDVAVEIRSDGTFAARLTRDALPPAGGARSFEGRFVRAGGLIAAWTALRAPLTER
jgi:4'-phosphopantetheinyl transferase EntD